MTEERVTKTIIKWLTNNGWKIISYDFPQSGTGVHIHPNESVREKTKNKGAVIFDIIAVKENNVVFFENKDRFYYDDFLKVDNLRNTDDYSDGISKILNSYNIEHKFYGIGGPKEKSFIEKSTEHEKMTDFIVTADVNDSVGILKAPSELF